MRQVRPGQSTLVFYTAHNLSDRAITGVSTYNVAPQQAGYYFNKIQCFCFEEQRLRPGACPRIAQRTQGSRDPATAAADAARLWRQLQPLPGGLLCTVAAAGGVCAGP